MRASRRPTIGDWYGGCFIVVHGGGIQRLDVAFGDLGRSDV
jgi:hypothetical protein